MKNEIREAFVKKINSLEEVKKQLNDEYVKVLVNFMVESALGVNKLGVTEEHVITNNHFGSDCKYKIFLGNTMFSIDLYPTEKDIMFNSEYYNEDYINEELDKYDAAIHVYRDDELGKIHYVRLVYTHMEKEKEQEKRR